MYNLDKYDELVFNFDSYHKGIIQYELFLDGKYFVLYGRLKELDAIVLPKAKGEYLRLILDNIKLNINLQSLDEIRGFKPENLGFFN